MTGKEIKNAEYKYEGPLGQEYCEVIMYQGRKVLKLDGCLYMPDKYYPHATLRDTWCTWLFMPRTQQGTWFELNNKPLEARLNDYIQTITT